jgi:carboxymethylenebutenolidase
MSKADLLRLWEEHTAHEFVTHDTEATLATMVEDAYVNHVPVLTGGYGKTALRAFYSRDFIPSMPPDTTLTPISRTVGDDQLVDEMIFSFTHTKEIPWMLPNIAATNRRVEIPLVAIVKFRDGRLAHEHIYWDQASVLKQIGLLTDPNLPVFGSETASKVADPQFQRNRSPLSRARPVCALLPNGPQTPQSIRASAHLSTRRCRAEFLQNQYLADPHKTFTAI